MGLVFRICMKYVEAALKNENSEEEQSVLQKVLRLDNNTKTAVILALDMFLVGIDTVRNPITR